MLIALFLTFGWQSFGRNMFADETRGGERTHLYGTQGPIASLPPSVACASTEGERDWPLSTMAFTVPLHLAALVFYELRPREISPPPGSRLTRDDRLSGLSLERA